MNYVYLSPHFPPNYYNFCVRLKEAGANVLGLADEPYDNLRPELKWALTEYFKVDDMHYYNQLLSALGYFTYKYGKIDRIDSHNEYWLETEAKLRTDFNIYGIKSDEIQFMKHKSKMKEKFIEAGVDVAKGVVINHPDDARRFVSDVGFPVVAKPDNGVGAAHTFKIHNYDELEHFLNLNLHTKYFMEEFIEGKMFTFDGLVDKNGNLVFYTSHTYSDGIMEVVNNNDHVFYYSLREIPHDLEEAGRKIIKAFNLKEKFFHFEFFRRYKDNKILALEVNMRPPGGLTTDMFNYANDIDIYREWANIVLFNEFRSQYNRKYHCCYIGRKNHKNYFHSHEEILSELKHMLVHHEPIFSVFSAALGDYGYLVRAESLDKIYEAVNFIHKLK